MTKLTQIKNALRAINGARFQVLCDHYLYRLQKRDIRILVNQSQISATTHPDYEHCQRRSTHHDGSDDA